MNRFKRISDRISWCEFRRLQSTLSTTASKVQIPPRIKRGPTDILYALERTIPKDSMNHNYLYHDDPFLLPQLKQDYRNFALAYEAGKKTAMWIHREHANLFPKKLSDPEIKAFKPPTKYTNESQVSDELLSQTIAEYKLFDAVDIYKLLGDRASNKTKQELLELLCFYNNENTSLAESPCEQWFITAKNELVWRFNPIIQELYEYLVSQDPLTAAAAHNAMICGLAKYSRVDEAFTLYHDCQKKNIPLNVNTYNYILKLASEIFGRKNAKKIPFVLELLQSMSDNGVKPNIQTVNSAINALRLSHSQDILRNLLVQFERMNIKFSLATYYYVLRVLSEDEENMMSHLRNMLKQIQNQSFDIQDPRDIYFFPHVMYLAKQYYDRKTGEMIHKILLTGDNKKFISNAAMENKYYTSYLSLMSSTSPIDEYFEIYESIVPTVYVPQKKFLFKMTDMLSRCSPEIIAKYLPKLWTDINTYCYPDLPMKLTMIHMMKNNSLLSDSDLQTSFVDAAWDCWKSIKLEVEEKPQNHTPIETARLGDIALVLLRGDRAEQSIEVLESITNRPDLYIPTMTVEEANQLFETCISKECIQGAILVLEHSANSGFPHVVDMAMKLHNLPQLTKVERDRLANLVGLENS